MSVMLYPCMLCVALLICLFVLCVACLTVFVNSPRTSGRRGGGVGILVNNAIKVTFRRIHVCPQITSFELMEAVLTICSISLRLIVIYRMPPPK